MKRTSLTFVKQTLNENGFSPLKKFGQNFLIDENTVEKIANIVNPDGRCIFEVGPGLGTLTERLLDKAEKMIAVEIDQGFYRYLNETFEGKSKLTLVNGDILKTDIAGLCQSQFGDVPVTVAANLPYYITSACIMAFLTAEIRLSRMVVMVQKEVAQRMCAEPGSRDYGLLSVIIDFFGDAKIGTMVSSGCFYPKPDVDSAVVVIEAAEAYPMNPDIFIPFVKACFGMKRKTLVNNLIKAGIKREKAEKALTEMGISTSVRAETLDTVAFVSLINRLGPEKK